LELQKMWPTECYQIRCPGPYHKGPVCIKKPEVKNMAMASTLPPAEEAQLCQTIEMVEVITQSQPHDYQSLEVLKHGYSKLCRDREAIGSSKRMAKAYVEMGQLSSAILEYETILQRCPDDPDVQAELKNIESKATSFPVDAPPDEPVQIRNP